MTLKNVLVKALLVAVVAAVAGLPAGAAPKTLTYLDLVRRLTDLEGLSVLPDAGDKCALCSSYDRASRYDEGTGKYVAWDANGDGRGIIRKEGDQIVMAEMEGPGCIWRIWSAQANAGHVKIYLDGAAEPAVDLPFSGYFDRKNAPFVYPALVNSTARGMNSYVPIPYQKSCKVVADPGWGNYYHFNYETFPKGTVVPTFKRDLSPEETAALAAADRLLSDGLGADPAGQRPGAQTVEKQADVPAGGTVRLADLKGPRAITFLKVKTDLATREEEMAALREMVLRITWDDDAAPAVWAPLGDFFGSAPGINAYKSLPLGMSKEGFYSAWFMPFGKRAVVEVVNDGEKARSLQCSITTAPLARPAADYGRFHAKWHRDAFLPAEPERKIDWPMVKTEGRGRFCGVMLHVWNPRGGWWGEGDEKLFVDGEKFPSTIGTGSEDYFGYAWGDPALFQNAYHNQTISSGNRGHVSVNRWHLTDDVPFQQSFEGCIEKYFPNSRPCLFACTAYWYLSPGGKDPYEPVPVKERTDYYAMPEATGVPGAIEGERMKILSKSGGNAAPQELSGFGDKWSNGEHLWWTGAKVGDKLVLAVPVKDAGKYDLKLQLTRARDYGIVQLSLDDKKLGDPIDLYDPNVVPSGVLTFAGQELTAGEHKLTVEITGANDKAIKSYMFGLDYVKLEAAK